jgi:hypothetical protein
MFQENLVVLGLVSGMVQVIEFNIPQDVGASVFEWTVPAPGREII